MTKVERRPVPCCACTKGNIYDVPEKCKVYLFDICTEAEIIPKEKLLTRYQSMYCEFLDSSFGNTENVLRVAETLKKEYGEEVDLPWIKERQKYLDSLCGKISKLVNPWWNSRWSYKNNADQFIKHNVPELVEFYIKKLKYWDGISKEIPYFPDSYYLLDKYPKKIDWELFSIFVVLGKDLSLIDKYADKIVWEKCLSHLLQTDMEIVERNIEHIDLTDWKIASIIARDGKEFLLKYPEKYDWKNQGWRVLEKGYVDEVKDYFNWKDHSVVMVEGIFGTNPKNILYFKDYFNWEDNIEKMRELPKYESCVTYYDTVHTSNKTKEEANYENLKKEFQKPEHIVTCDDQIITAMENNKITIDRKQYSMKDIAHKNFKLFRQIPTHLTITV